MAHSQRYVSVCRNDLKILSVAGRAGRLTVSGCLSDALEWYGMKDTADSPWVGPSKEAAEPQTARSTRSVRRRASAMPMPQ
eukprot:COSAG02_NODE_1446_length_12578_cov_3.488661_11_plen_81_part_00